MALFPISGVLRGSSACGVLHVRLGVNPCAALLIEKITDLRNWKLSRATRSNCQFRTEIMHSCP